MNVHIDNVQILKQNGVPAFAVIPYESYIAVFQKGSVPQEVAEMAILQDIPLIKAWRVYKGFTQKSVAKRAGITQAALSQMERTENPNRTSTLEKLAEALDLSVEQLTD